MMFDEATQRSLVAEASLSPSVHNIQPARWRFSGDEILLFEDPRRRLPAGDPTGRDSSVSLGSAAAGMAIALSARGWVMEKIDPKPTHSHPFLHLIAPYRVLSSTQIDPFFPHLGQRYSHRGAFLPPTPADRAAAMALHSGDLTPLTDLGTVASHYDAASLRFFRDKAFRAELTSWMRLKPSHPRWALDGLNADAMALSTIEAAGAGIVLGPKIFSFLDVIGLSGPLTAESSKVTGAAAVLVLHRPADEDPFISGGFFHRAWLRFVAAGFQGAVMAALADDETARAAVAALAGIPENHRVITTFRIGRAPADAAPARARLPVDELII